MVGENLRSMISDENPFLAMGDWPQVRKIRLGPPGNSPMKGGVVV
jgi:hypothetical protein